jgi:hypothetical protein
VSEPMAEAVPVWSPIPEAEADANAELAGAQGPEEPPEPEAEL